MLEYLHLITFMAWLPLAFLTYSLKNNSILYLRFRIISAITFILCLYVFYMHFYWSYKVINPIRLDLLFLIPTFSTLFLFIGVWGIRKYKELKLKMFLISSLLLILLSLPTLMTFLKMTFDIQKDMTALNSIPSLLLEAQFQSALNFKRSFGETSSDNNSIVGYYESPKNTWATRLIINKEGHLWLYFKCGDNTECVHSEADINLANFKFPNSFPLKTNGIANFSATLSSDNFEQFSFLVLIEDHNQKKQYMGPVTFKRSSIPFRSQGPLVEKVKYLGSYSELDQNGKNIELIQLWIWQSEDKILAYYVRLNSTCDLENNFIYANTLQGEYRSQKIVLKNSQSKENILINNLTDKEISGEVEYYGRFLRAFKLKKEVIIQSRRYDIAPLKSFEETRNWLNTISKGYMLQWKAKC